MILYNCLITESHIPDLSSFNIHCEWIAAFLNVNTFTMCKCIEAANIPTINVTLQSIVTLVQLFTPHNK